MSFLEFLRLVNPRFFQERDAGLDLYLSGPWGWIPAGLAVAAATVFVLALFHVVPRRRHSVPIVLGIGVVALAVGLLGSWINLSAHPPDGPGPWPRVVTEGRGRTPETASQIATLLAIPALAGSAAAAAAFAAAAFLLVFGGRTREGKRDDGSDSPGARARKRG